MANFECGHDHERVVIPVPGSNYGHSRKWQHYRVEIEAIVVKTYASLDERRSDRQWVYGGPLWENPNNPLQLIRPLTWRAYYKNARGYAEANYHGAASVQGFRMDHPESPAVELAVHKGLTLLRRVEREHSGRKHKYADPGRFLDATYDAYISTCDDPDNFDDKYEVTKIAKAMGISRDTWYSTVAFHHLDMDTIRAEARRRLRDSRTS
jgi:hypothetical protein